MANQTITQLPSAGPITGTELIPLVQNGQTVKATVQAINSSPTMTQTFLTVNQEPTLTNSQYLAGGAGVGLTSGGAQSYLRIVLNGASGSLEGIGNGMVAKTNSSTVAARTLTASGAGLEVTNGDGVSGNPTFALSGVAAAVANLGGTGIMAIQSGTTVGGVQILGTTNQIAVANGNGIGNPTVSIVDNVVLPGIESVILPKGNTAERSSTPVNGMLRYNTQTATFEGYANNTWGAITTGSGVTSIETGTGLQGGPITSTGTISIADTGVVAASYGSSSDTLVANVNAQGQLTSLAETPIAIANTQVSGLGTASTLNAGVANGVATLDSGGTVPLSQIPASIQGGLIYQGTWNASTNTPTLTSSVGTKGYYYAVSVAGSTNLNGITDWNIGDLAVFNGSVWEQIDNTDAVTSVNGYTGTVVLTASDIGGLGTMATQNANSVAITGGAIDGTTIGSTTPAAGTFTTLTATGQTSLGGAAGSEGLRVTTTASANRYVNASGGVAGSFSPALGTGGGTGGLALYANQGAINFFSDGNATTQQMSISRTASAVNYVQVTGSATGVRPAISAQGSDTNIGLQFISKGTGTIRFDTRGGNGIGLLIGDSGSATNANYIQITGAATTISPTVAANGSDTNISQVFQSKGTGAIDLAAGSSGVNISNGGTVTAITKTQDGTSYTTLPTVTVSAPTTAGGTQATLQLQMYYTPSIVSGGTGYTNGDVLTIVGGTPVTSAGSITVTSVSGGVITGVVRTNFNGYTALPSNPISVTGGTGSGATFNLTWAVGAIVITNAGSGYVEQPTVSFSGGGGSGAAAYATVGSGTVVRSLNGTMSFFTPAGESVRIDNPSYTTLTDYVSLAGGASVSGAYVSVGGSTANANLYVSAKGTGSVALFTNGQGNARQLNVAHTASAVNYVQVTGAATTVAPQITAQGSDTNIAMVLSSKGTSDLQFRTNNSGQVQFQVLHTASAVNRPTATGAIAGAAPVIGVAGTDTNIDLALTPKGTGKVTTSSTFVATGGIQGGAF